MNLNAWVLGSAGLGVAAIGGMYLIAPEVVLAIYGVQMQSVSHANIVRGAYGGLFLAFAVLFCLGATKERYTDAARIALLTFMAGFAAGRVASFAVDGLPHLLLVAVFGVEVVYSCAALYLIRRQADRRDEHRA